MTEPTGGHPRGTYTHTEATRLLCAGVHVNPTFRHLVIDELMHHSERPVPPPLGVDVQPVLAHALEARRREHVTAALLLGVWAAFTLVELVMFRDSLSDQPYPYHAPFGDLLGNFFLGGLFPGGVTTGGHTLPGGTVTIYAGVCLLLWAGRALTGRATSVAGIAPGSAGRTGALSGVGVLVRIASVVALPVYGVWALVHVVDDPYAVIFPLLFVCVVWRRRIDEREQLRTWLSRATFAQTRQPALPVALSELGRMIEREQWARLTLYDPNLPFVGAGVPRGPWSLVLELRRKDEEKRIPAQSGRPLTAASMIDMIRPKLQSLRNAAERDGKDRLRDLEIEDFVFLPKGAERHQGVYDEESVEAHLAASVDESGEGRRHFLRLRVGAWDEQVVVSLLVRVHTQGGMLVLEVLPHVLGPVIAQFRAVDMVLDREPRSRLREAWHALCDAPAVGVSVGFASLRGLVAQLRLGTRSEGQILPDAPRLSLREIAATTELSLFQETDVTRYIRTLQERIANGVRDALEEHGYRTDRFEQQVVNVRDGGVFIRDMSGGAVATGKHGQAHQHSAAAAPLDRA